MDPPEVEQVIELTAGWNLISLHLTPEPNGIQEIFALLIEAEVISIIRDSHGNFCAPAWDFYGIDIWNPGEGLQVLISEDSELRISGISFDPQFPIQLDAGWQILPYYPYYRLDVRIALAGLGEHLTIIKDVYGDFYWPHYNYCDMEEMRPGQGYYIYVSDDVELVYPLEEE
ncbi:MAG: hypothetical protein HQ568_02755 [Calditrichaeota bacterium]|nr:hypothetical protein [Calditrichota bacterium]